MNCKECLHVIDEFLSKEKGRENVSKYWCCNSKFILNADSGTLSDIYLLYGFQYTSKSNKLGCNFVYTAAGQIDC